MMGALAQDIRFGIRTLVKNPVFTTVAVLALAIGIGANSAIFSVIDAVLLRPLPYYESNRLVKIWEKRPQLARGNVSFADFKDWKDQSHVFEEVAAYQTGDYNLTGGDEPEQVQGVAASSNLFTLLHAQAEKGLGRTFLPEEENQGSNSVVILSHDLWANRFGSDRSLIGKAINIDNKNYLVVGIMPNHFYFPGKEFELWVPLAINPNSAMAGRGMHYLQALGRLKSGTSLEQARAEMDAIASHLEQQYPRDNTGHGINLFSLQGDSSAGFRSSLLMILLVVGFVLLIACANVANLLLARAAARQKEIALRSALGASRGRIVRQLVTESILLSFLGGGLGLVLAGLGLRVLLAVSPAGIPRIEESGLNGSVLAFTVLITLATGIIFGLAPAVQISKPDINELLKGGSARGSTSSSSSTLRKAFVVIEVALSLVLLIGAGLMIKSFSKLLAVSPGFNVENVLTASITLPNSKYRGSQRAVFLQQVLERIQTEPQVTAAGAVTHLPLAGNGPTFDFNIQGRPQAVPGEEFKAQMRCASSNYFRALGIPVLAGRQFSAQDSSSAPNVVIINDVMAQRYWPNESPLEKQISLDKDDNGNPIWRRIVGVVRGVRHTSLEFEPEPQMYTPYSQFSMPFIIIVLHTNTAPLNLAADLRRIVTAVDKDQPIAKIRTMEQVVSESTAPRRFNMLLLSLFAGVALLLASIGIYGVISYSVTQRTREIGIRSALGAQRFDILKLVIGQGMFLALIGVGVGLVASFALTRGLSSLLFGVSTTDPLVFIEVTALLLFIAVMACYLPARRATKVNSMVALRYE
jgi:putative ABC transport system permease protein